ncbi:uncharacterized protein FOMMEDRAFT_20621 [Fomitiporia mediterranea MF3/22]|uniref:uncharacterized protein n=1 Tax=Fomitiporia mediterranea (strain MF3/22) TaxID=694068 RepID=UPI0004407BFC|nr:uncharacterized protein FOMMEDRAFT_20621 [Fomitiporia mediterranea MF3/22]EJD01846.1 hypothetical protein FOMMEDRAFT_20621 [Fomitiporia mediterranea MF3/22]
MNTATRVPPPQGAPPSYAFVTRVYRRSLRPVVVFVSFLGGLWALVWGIASFRDISVDNDHAAKLEVFDIVLGSLYMATFVIELFGLAAASMQKLPMIRAYAFLSLGAAVVVIATELIRVIIHFVFKNTLISECQALVNGETITTRFGIWGTTTETLDGQTAEEFCRDAWSHDSFSEIAWFIVTAILSLLFASIAFSYYRQMLDPSSIVNVSRNAAPQHYNPPYAAGAYGYNNGPYGGFGASGYGPPPGPPPAQSQAYVPQYDPAKLPDYEQGGYTGTTGDRKGDDDLKGGADPFSDFEHRKGSGEGSRDRV